MPYICQFLVAVFLRDLWAEILDMETEDIGKNDSFLQLGGDSISAIQLVTLARHHDVELYSAHSDGSIAAWKPRTEEDAELDEEEEQERQEAEGSRKRKRGVLEDIYQDLTKRKITFGGL